MLSPSSAPQQAIVPLAGQQPLLEQILVVAVAARPQRNGLAGEAPRLGVDHDRRQAAEWLRLGRQAVEHPQG